MFKEKYAVYIQGCDDTTAIAIELTDDQRDTLIELCNLSYKNSKYGCQPVMDIYNYSDLEEWSEEDDEEFKLRYSAPYGKELNRRDR